MSSGPFSAFIDELARRGYDSMLANAVGTARFEVTDGGPRDRWLVTIDKGTITVSRKNTKAGTIVRGERKTFDEAASGRLNMMAAALRGEIVIAGDPRFLVQLQRLFPRPSDAA
jgi:putative sterol carrier protein